MRTILSSSQLDLFEPNTALDPDCTFLQELCGDLVDLLIDDVEYDDEEMVDAEGLWYIGMKRMIMT